MPCRHSSQPPSRQSGAALVVAMLVFAVCAALVVAMRGEFQRFYQRNANILVAEQAQSYLRGAEELAALALVQDHDRDVTSDQPRDDLTEFWATPADQRPPYTFEEGWMIGELEDLRGRFNLNTLANANPRDDGSSPLTSAQRQFIRLMQAVGEEPISEYEATRIARAVGDWVDANQTPADNGAEDSFYAGRDPGYRAANRPMVSVTELRAIGDMTPQLYADLAPWVTVLPDTQPSMNIHTAPAVLLRTVNSEESLQPLTEDEGAALVQRRLEVGFADVEDFLQQPVFQGKPDMDGWANVLTQESDYYLLRAEAQVADRNMRLYSVLQIQNRRVTSLARSSGSL